MKIKRPMLAETVDDISKIHYPVFASPKIDGIRCLLGDRYCVSRTLKPIPNIFIQNILTNFSCVFYPSIIFDGELVVGNTFQDTTSGVMSEDGQPEFTYYIFDIQNDKPFNERFKFLSELTLSIHPHILFHLSALITCKEDLQEYIDNTINSGFEGVILRRFNGQYKHGRSTLNEEYLLKVKPFEDSEAEIVGWEELEINGNCQTTNALGLSERSTAKEGKVPGNTLGAFVCRDVSRFPGIIFKVGSGFTQEQRQFFWHQREQMKGKYIKYKYQKIGTKDAPRTPIFLGIRGKEDMS